MDGIGNVYRGFVGKIAPSSPRANVRVQDETLRYHNNYYGRWYGGFDIVYRRSPSWLHTQFTGTWLWSWLSPICWLLDRGRWQARPITPSLLLVHGISSFSWKWSRRLVVQWRSWLFRPNRHGHGTWTFFHQCQWSSTTESLVLE